MTKVALVLSGCGFLDGTEITEAVSCILHLSRLGAEASFFAPDKPQAGVVNHATGEPAEESRNVLVESARIARGRIAPVAQLRAADFDAVVFPGGYGAAENLCDFARAGAGCQVDSDVERVLKEFQRAGKPVGLCCIAPVLAARALGVKSGGPGVRITAGCDPGVAKAVAEMGSSHVNRPVTEAEVDEEQNVITAPAYMYGDATPNEVYIGIGEMIENVVERARNRAGTAAASRR